MVCQVYYCLRYGTWSILAALDLHGHVTARVEERHRSVEFIALLQDLENRVASRQELKERISPCNRPGPSFH